MTVNLTATTWGILSGKKCRWEPVKRNRVNTSCTVYAHVIFSVIGYEAHAATALFRTCHSNGGGFFYEMVI